MYGIHKGHGLAGKSVLVTGGASGIGRSTALLLADVGANVTIGDINEAGMAETVALGKGLSGAIKALKTNVGAEGDLAALVTAAVQNFGRLDCAANVAGLAPSHKLLHEVTQADWQRSIDVNLAGVFFGMKHQIIQMLKQGGGAIVNIASAVAIKSLPHTSEYTAAKSGLFGLAKAALQDYGRQNIRINTIMPGVVYTQMVRDSLSASSHNDESTLTNDYGLVGRMAHPDELGYAVRWLLSDEASFVTGACLAVDGGATSN